MNRSRDVTPAPEAAAALPSAATCWCGSREFGPAPHRAYAVCRGCGSASLVELLERGPEAMRERLAEFYAGEYWREHQTAHAMPPLEERARQDLGERCAYWLGHLLRYRAAPAAVLEVGCGHGGLLKLAELCGYEVTGTEVSEEAARFGRQEFGLPIRTGFFEDQADDLGVHDCVVLLDVLEHFAEPDAVLGRVTRHLEPDGVVMIQTPCHRPDLPADWPMYFPPEHTVLFSRDALKSLLGRHGLAHVEFEPALFDYDMFAFASRTPLSPASMDAVQARLEATPGGRVMLALLETGACWREARGELARVRQHAAALEAALARLRGHVDALTRSRWMRLGRFLRLIRPESPLT